MKKRKINYYLIAFFLHRVAVFNKPWHFMPCLTNPNNNSPQKSQNVGDL